MKLAGHLPDSWNEFLPKERFGLGVSLLLHGSILAALVLSINFGKTPIPPQESPSIDISLIAGDWTMAAIPKIAAPKSEVKPVEVPKEQPKPVIEAETPSEVRQDVVPEPAKASSGFTASADPSPDAGSPNMGGLIWTPPAPRPNDADPSMTAMREERERVTLPHVELGKGASEAVLLSYDQGRYSDTASISEALRLTGTGRITMTASVDDKGLVTQCAITVTSGSKLLDERACALVSSYQYRPAQDARGVPHASIVSEVLEWAKDGVFAAPGDPPEDMARRISGMPKVEMPKPNRR